MAKADIILIEGEQGSGKSNTAVAKVVDAYKKDPTTKIFTNFHLYGIKHVYADLATIIEYLNTDLIKDGWVVIDESYIGADARAGMSLLTRILTWFGMQIRKRNLHLIVIAQHGRMIDWRFKFFATEHIICSYNEDTHYVTCEITKRGDRRKNVVSYYAPQYWKYFDSFELPPIPENVIGRVLEGVK